MSGMAAVAAEAAATAVVALDQVALELQDLGVVPAGAAAADTTAATAVGRVV